MLLELILKGFFLRILENTVPQIKVNLLTLTLIKQSMCYFRDCIWPALHRTTFFVVSTSSELQAKQVKDSCFMPNIAFSVLM